MILICIRIIYKSGDLIFPFDIPIHFLVFIVISRQALAREGDYEMHPVRACVRV